MVFEKNCKQDGYSRRSCVCNYVMNLRFNSTRATNFRTHPTLTSCVTFHWWGRSVLQLPNSNQPDPDSRCIPLTCFSVPRQCVRCVFWCVLVHIASHQRTCERENPFLCRAYVTRNVVLVKIINGKTFSSRCLGHVFPTFR